MKAEHRKELKTNQLAIGMEKLYEKAKSGSNLLWGGLVLIVALGVGYWWFTARSANQATDAWTAYWNSRDSAESLESLTGRLKGTAAEQAARLALADQLYEEGYQALVTKSPKRANDKFTEATKTYEELAKNASDSELGLRAALGAGRAQESLGEVDRAKWFYDEAVTRYGKLFQNKSGQQHPLVAEAERRLKLLNDGAGLAFYQGKAGTTADKRWPHRLPSIEYDPAKSPPIPGLPPSIDQRPSPLGGP